MAKLQESISTEYSGKSLLMLLSVRKGGLVLFFFFFWGGEEGFIGREVQYGILLYGYLIHKHDINSRRTRFSTNYFQKLFQFPTVICALYCSKNKNSDHLSQSKKIFSVHLLGEWKITIMRTIASVH